MTYYLAPMEGITGYVYRRAYHAHFRPMDRYFTPFIAPKHNSVFSARDRNEILPEHNQGQNLIPQLLTSQSETLLQAARGLKEYGYREININLGCPSPTVVTKKKGSGFLAFPEELEQFLEEITEGLERLDMKYSIKTRLGKDSPEEFGRLLEIYNRFPLTELIIHPRIQQDFYKNDPRLAYFIAGMEGSRSPVCYNGDLFMPDSCKKLEAHLKAENCPMPDRVMLGRGILSNPWLPGRMEAAPEAAPSRDQIRSTLKEFHHSVYEGYRQVMSGDRNVLFKMKELWLYLIQPFSDDGSHMKRLRKAQRLGEYESAVSAIFHDLDFDIDGGFKGY